MLLSPHGLDSSHVTHVSLPPRDSSLSLSLYLSHFDDPLTSFLEDLTQHTHSQTLEANYYYMFYPHIKCQLKHQRVFGLNRKHPCFVRTSLPYIKSSHSSTMQKKCCPANPWKKKKTHQQVIQSNQKAEGAQLSCPALLAPGHFAVRPTMSSWVLFLFLFSLLFKIK